jgi:hypothetical protein
MDADQQPHLRHSVAILARRRRHAVGD